MVNRTSQLLTVDYVYSGAFCTHTRTGAENIRILIRIPAEQPGVRG